MRIASSQFEERLADVFRRVFRRPYDPAAATPATLEEWDSLSHIKLVMELEAEFGITIAADAVAELYADASVILSFLDEHVEEGTDRA